jgi:hypothetical protein
MNVYIGEGRLVHSNPPRCKSTYKSEAKPTSKPVTCAGCKGKLLRKEG